MAKNPLRRRRPRTLLVAGSSIALGFTGCGAGALPGPDGGATPDLSCASCGGNAFCPPACYPTLDFAQPVGRPADVGNYLYFDIATPPPDLAVWAIDNGMPPPRDLAVPDLALSDQGTPPDGFDGATIPDGGAKDR